MKLHTVKNYVILLFIIMNLSLVFSLNTQAAGSSVRRVLIENLMKLTAEGLIEAEIYQSESEGIFEIKFNKPSAVCISIAPQSVLNITNTKLNGNLNLCLYSYNLPMILQADISQDSVSGSISINSPLVICRIQFSAFLTSDDSLALTASAVFDNLKLKGPPILLKTDLEYLSLSVRNCLKKIGVSRYNVSLSADKSLHHLSEYLECRASFKMHCDESGECAGGVDVAEGDYIYLGSRFNIKEGFYFFKTDSIGFLVEKRQKTYITLPDSGAVLRSYRITLGYWGGIDKGAELQLMSTPHLTAEEIRRLLVKGNPFIPAVSGVTASNLEQQIELAISQYDDRSVTNYAELQAGRLFTFDRVEIKKGLLSSKNRFIASKDITSRLEMTIKGSLGSSTEGSVVFDYRLMPHIYLTNETARLDRTGIDLKYVIKFW